MFNMDELVKTVDPYLEYQRHEMDDGIMRLFVKSTRDESRCPYCGTVSNRVHSVYFRKFRDLPIQGKKAEIIIDNRKYFCVNPECGHKTFAEIFDCLPKMGRRSRRLTEAIVNTAVNLSSITASKTLRQGTADVGKSTICRLLKKEHSNRRNNRQGEPEDSLY